MGGAENFVYTFLESLDNARFEKYIVCPAGGYYTEKFSLLTKKVLLVDPRRSFMNLGIILRVAKFIKENKIDIIHTMLYTSDFCGIVARRFSGRPCILNTINGFNFMVLEKGSLRLKRRIASFVYRFIYRYSDRLIAVSEAVRQDLIDRNGIKADPKKIKTVLAAGINASHTSSGGDIKDFRINSSGDKKLIVSAIGTLNEVKDYDNILEALSLVLTKYSDVKLFIAGDGPDKERLEKRMSDLGLNANVYFLGNLEDKRKNDLLSITDIFIIGSISEGCPTSLLEAMCFEKPIVATKVGGIPEIIKHDESGLLVPARDPVRLADAILDLVKDEEKRMRFGKKAKQIFQERFTQRHMLETYESIYNKALATFTGVD